MEKLWAIFIFHQVGRELELYSDGHETELQALNRLDNANPGNKYVILPYYQSKIINIRENALKPK